LLWCKFAQYEAVELLKTFLEKKAETIAKEKGKDSLEKAIKQLQLREEKQCLATQIKAIWNKLQLGGVSRVTYIDEQGILQESMGREHLELLCNSANEDKIK
jgi:hypothetical protein